MSHNVNCSIIESNLEKLMITQEVILNSCPEYFYFPMYQLLLKTRVDTKGPSHKKYINFINFVGKTKSCPFIYKNYKKYEVNSWHYPSTSYYKILYLLVFLQSLLTILWDILKNSLICKHEILLYALFDSNFLF